jgi:pyruvate/2-oxoglutarate dehydrogenase complex dihydrolipoamide dehydrogenase (E3) component
VERDAFDVIVVGAGMAGMNAADRAVRAGASVAVIERDRVGGTCPIRGCIPSKALIRSAEIAHEARRAAEFGINVGAVDVDFPAVMERVRRISDQGSRGAQRWLESLAGLELLFGEATLVDERSVRVGNRTLTAPRIIIATGAQPSTVPIAGLDGTPHLTSDDVLLDITELPGRLLVVGAGPIALELGQALSRLGSTVTLVEVAPRFLPGAEPDLADRLQECLVSEGLSFRIGAAIERVEPRDDGGVRMLMNGGTAPEVLEGDALLVAAGRSANVAPLGLEHAGVAFDTRGIRADGRLQTTVPGVWAAGDVLGPGWGQFTHTARREGVHAVESALGIASHDLPGDMGPRAIFTDPEFVSVGLTEAAAREAGWPVSVGTGTFSGGKARAWGEERGAVKVIVHAGSGRILGAHILGYHASDLIHPIGVAMQAGDGGVDLIARTHHVHPTMGEVVKAAVTSSQSA